MRGAFPLRRDNILAARDSTNARMPSNRPKRGLEPSCDIPATLARALRSMSSLYMGPGSSIGPGCSATRHAHPCLSLRDDVAPVAGSGALHCTVVGLPFRRRGPVRSGGADPRGRASRAGPGPPDASRPPRGLPAFARFEDDCCIADRGGAYLASLQRADAKGCPRRTRRRCGREAEGGGLLNRYRVVKPYRGFESLRLRQRRGSR